MILKLKAMDFARLLKVECFNACADWSEMFKVRHNIVFQILHGQTKDISHEACIEWKKNF